MRTQKASGDRNSNPVNIGVLIPSLVYGGAERWTHDLVQYCDPNLVSWQGCVLPDNAWVDYNLLRKLSSKIPVYYNNYIWHRNKKQKTSQNEAIKTLLFDVNLVLTWEVDESMRSILDGLNVKIIHVAHRNDKNSIAPMVKKTDFLAGVWSSCKEVFGVSDTSIVKIIPNGVDLNRCVPILSSDQIRKQWGSSSNSTVVGYIGRLDPRKNIMALAKAVSALGPNALGVIYGTKAAHSDGVEESMRCVAPNQLLFFPPTEDIGSVLNAIDVFILPSFDEVFSLSLLEAWGASVPIVATEVGALLDLERKYGKLAVTISPNASGIELAHAIKKATSDSKREQLIRSKAAKMVFKNYNIHLMVFNWTKYFIQCNEDG